MQYIAPATLIFAALIAVVGFFIGWLVGHARDNTGTQKLMNDLNDEREKLADANSKIKRLNNKNALLDHKVGLLIKEIDRRQGVIDAYQIGQPEPNVIRFLSIAKTLISDNPYLYVEIGRTRTTSWMAMLFTKPRGDLIVSGQGETADAACSVLINKMLAAEEDAQLRETL